jgi:hypothetical protein
MLRTQRTPGLEDFEAFEDQEMVLRELACRRFQKQARPRGD